MSKTISSRERVLATLGRKPPDRPAAPHLDADDESLERRDEWGVTHRWVRFGAGGYEEVARQTEWVCMLSFISIFEVYCALKPMDEALMSLEMWREFFKEPYAELISTVHDRGCYAFYHTDGSAFDIVADLVGLGIDVLNPIQHRCPGMDRERLFDTFGDRVVFHGAGGGYIVAPCHMIQAGTPVENIVAMYEAAKEGG